MQCHDSSSNIRLNSIKHHKKTFSVWIKNFCGKIVSVVCTKLLIAENVFDEIPLDSIIDKNVHFLSSWILIILFFFVPLWCRKKQFYNDENFFYFLLLFLNIFPRKNFILSNFCGMKNWKYSVRSEDIVPLVQPNTNWMLLCEINLTMCFWYSLFFAQEAKNRNSNEKFYSLNQNKNKTIYVSKHMFHLFCQCWPHT